MRKETLYKEKPLSFFTAPEIIFPDEKFDIEQKFIDRCLNSPPSEAVEDVSSEVHETNRIPDPRILIIDGKNILRLDGKRVDDSIEKNSYLGRLEYEAFVKIKEWSSENNDGVELWFSPSFDGIYPVEKIDIGEIRYASNGTKILLKKAVLLDIGRNDFLELANNFTMSIGYSGFTSSEILRARPIFCTRPEMEKLLSSLSGLTNQIEMISKGEDLYKKSENYQTLTHFHEEINISPDYRYRSDYYYIRERAEQEKMLGEKSVSCPSVSTAFQSFSGDYHGGVEDEYGSLTFTCPHCGATNTRPYGKLLSNCQHCGKSVRC